MKQKGMDFSYQIHKKYLTKITNGHLGFFSFFKKKVTQF